MDLSGAENYDQRKHDAYAFLKEFENTLNSTLPPPTDLRTEIRKTAGDAEDAFLSRFVIPKLHGTSITTTPYLTNSLANMGIHGIGQPNLNLGKWFQKWNQGTIRFMTQ